MAQVLVTGAQSPEVLFPIASNGAPAFGNTAAMTAAGHKTAWVGRMCNKDRAAKQIRFVEVRTGATITKAGGSTVQFSIQGVNAAGGPPYQPDGTVSGATNNCKETEANASIPAVSTWWTTGNFTEDSSSIAHGQLVAVVAEYATFGGADSIQFSGVTVPLNVSPFLQGAGTSVLTASWTLDASRIAVIVLGFSDGTYGTLRGAIPASSLTTTVINTGSAAKQVGMEITPSVAMGIDVFTPLLQMAANSEADINFYTGTTLTEKVAGIAGGTTVDLNTISASATVRWMPEVLSQSYTLTAGTTYRLMVKPTTANNLTFYDMTLANAAHRQCLPFGTDVQYVTADTTPTFTGTNTRYPLIIPGISSWDDGLSAAGSGGRFIGG